MSNPSSLSPRPSAATVLIVLAGLFVLLVPYVFPICHHYGIFAWAVDPETEEVSPRPRRCSRMVATNQVIAVLILGVGLLSAFMERDSGTKVGLFTVISSLALGGMMISTRAERGLGLIGPDPGTNLTTPCVLKTAPAYQFIFSLLLLWGLTAMVAAAVPALRRGVLLRGARSPHLYLALGGMVTGLVLIVLTRTLPRCTVSTPSLAGRIGTVCVYIAPNAVAVFSGIYSFAHLSLLRSLPRLSRISLSLFSALPGVAIVLVATGLAPISLCDDPEAVCRRTLGLAFLVAGIVMAVISLTHTALSALSPEVKQSADAQSDADHEEHPEEAL